MQHVPFTIIYSSTLVFKFLKMHSENSFIKRFGWSVMEIYDLIFLEKLFNEMDLYKKFFFVSSHIATWNHTHYPIANSLYMNKYSLHVQTQPMLAGALADGRRAVRWATDYFLKAHVAPNEFYGQVGRGDLDHSFWGRPEDMTMARPAFKIDTSRPGKNAPRSFFPTSKSHLSSGESTACAKWPRHSQFWHLLFGGTWQTLWFQALYSQRLYSQAIHLLMTFRTLKTGYLFTALKTTSCNLKVRIWPARLPPPSLQRPLCSGMSTPLIPTDCSQAPGSFSTSPTDSAADTVIRSPRQGISTRECSILST